ncbi:thiamine phosphate synthase [Paenarthrobacter aurescens]|uniref:Thiamine-phosphate synthase n=1 Tax=Paenarthrobacter aurescens TaxID=43663 RepID=A0A4Y3NNQ4_PAEAU|nr:thiamine phosphate synthase [Paenarthrobacter aurescens]UKA48580.1 thiamine phosphate synthase [Arthrobacter sp. FW305-123]MDO6144183.1 thiamine phosphate synthase [Paenarthrobacter aurescens]MDO6148030.1 thiamine phosphate synthase [Paenarthrobacter aurescens]MDO6159274.1 thiamine phosphate synthase [Paenarthrobacter aurescens]MDO6163257.1 thiamine phosphate synthase [Paenarthrobacter aurescens]
MTQPDALAAARLYLCTDARKRQGDFEDFVDAAFEGGVDIIQLRDKTLEAAEELEILAVLRSVAQRHGKLWAVNDRADVASISGAPVFHIGQKDLPLTAARTLLPNVTGIGLSTHTPEQIDAALATAQGPLGLDYFCVGPVWATPTKPGRAAVGTGLVTYAAEAQKRADHEVTLPWFAIGGIDHNNVEEVVAAGAGRIVVVRAITEATDPTAAAKSLLQALDAV